MCSICTPLLRIKHATFSAPDDVNSRAAVVRSYYADQPSLLEHPQCPRFGEPIHSVLRQPLITQHKVFFLAHTP
jgi:hypothetical protein